MVQIILTVEGKFRDEQEADKQGILDEEFAVLNDAIATEMEYLIQEGLRETLASPALTVTYEAKHEPKIDGRDFTDVITLRVAVEPAAPGIQQAVEGMLDKFVDNLYQSRAYWGSDAQGLDEGEGSDALTGVPGIGSNIVQTGGRKTRRARRHLSRRKSRSQTLRKGRHQKSQRRK